MQATDFVESYLDAWNHCDPRGVADHLAADGIYRDVPQNVQTTHDELIGHLTDFFAAEKHRYELIGEILTGSDTIAFEYRMRPLAEGRGSNTSTAYRGAEFMCIHGEAAVTITDYYDVPGRPKSSQLPRMTSRDVHMRKYAKSGLSNRQLLDYKARLEQYMQAQQAFLQPDLSLPKLANAIDCSVNHLSQVINSGFGLCFFDYLNRYRIEHAKTLLTRPDGKDNAVLNIAFAAGFNSNSAFYAAFRKCVGQTPTQYRNAQLSRLTARGAARRTVAGNPV